MAPLDSIRAALANPRELERGVLMRRTAMTLTWLGMVYALLYAVAFAVPGGGNRVALCGAALGVLGLISYALPPRGEIATVIALSATVIIAVILTTQDRTATVPLFFLWPLCALAYYHSRSFLVGSVVFATVCLLPVLVIGGDADSQVTFFGAVSTAALMAALVSLMRDDTHRLRSSLLRSGSTDALTGLLNRRAFMPAFERELAHARERATDLSVVLVDLDHFKQFNDTRGHLLGDRALRSVARVLSAAAGPSGLVARLGGEEFAIVLPGSDRLGAQQFCDRVAAALAPVAPDSHEGAVSSAAVRAGLRAQLAALAPEEAAELHAFETPPRQRGASPDTPLPPITASSGIVHVEPGTAGDATAESLLGLADDALYAAKRAGRDRSAVWTGDRVMLAPPFHVGGRLMVGDVEPVTPMRSAAEPVLDPQALLNRRAQLLFRVTAGMYLLGGANVLAAAFLLVHTPGEIALRLGTAAVLAVIGSVLLFTRPSTALATPLGFSGTAIISFIIATETPIGSTPLFYVWPVAMVAYFASPRALAAQLVWVAASLAGALALNPQDVNDVGLVIGLTLNVAVLGAFISGMRWREERLADQLERVASIDPLTGALTRRGFLPILSRWIANSPGGTSPTGVAFLLIDVDHFKRFNDEHGHLAGDAALRDAAAAMREVLPAGGLLCRFGGEEFVVAIPEGGLGVARAYAVALAAQLAAQSHGLTISAGIAVGTEDERETEDLVGRADDALYVAKHAGRNRCAWWPSDDGAPMDTTGPIAGTPFRGDHTTGLSVVERRTPRPTPWARPAA